MEPLPLEGSGFSEFSGSLVDAESSIALGIVMGKSKVSATNENGISHCVPCPCAAALVPEYGASFAHPFPSSIAVHMVPQPVSSNIGNAQIINRKVRLLTFEFSGRQKAQLFDGPLE